MNAAAWLVAIFSQIRPKKLFTLNAIGAIIVNTEDEYDVMVDHVSPSPNRSIDHVTIVSHPLVNYLPYPLSPALLTP